MKYVTTFFWTFVLGEVLGYVGSALEGVSYNATTTSLFAMVIGAISAIGLAVISTSAAPKSGVQADTK